MSMFHVIIEIADVDTHSSNIPVFQDLILNIECRAAILCLAAQRHLNQMTLSCPPSRKWGWLPHHLTSHELWTYRFLFDTLNEGDKHLSWGSGPNFDPKQQPWLRFALEMAPALDVCTMTHQWVVGSSYCHHCKHDMGSFSVALGPNELVCVMAWLGVSHGSHPGTNTVGFVTQHQMCYVRYTHRKNKSHFLFW